MINNIDVFFSRESCCYICISIRYIHGKKRMNDDIKDFYPETVTFLTLFLLVHIKSRGAAPAQRQA